MAERVTGLRHDLLGRIFHRVLDTARYDGSYYTSTAAAVLLASVAIREEDSDWGNSKAVAALRICDPACGTGTLLMAAAERIRDLRNRRGLLAPDDEEALGLSLVEDVLWGYDVNLTATHMAASTLGMLSPSTRFHRMNVHRALLGVFNDSPYLGSLDFLSGQARLAGWPSATQQVESGEAVALPPLMNLVIMNPPFTRDSLRHDQFSREDELAIKQREKAVMENLPDRAAARLSGSANAFMVLGERMVRAVDGTLAVVLPTVMATNPAAFHTRRYLAQRFHIDTIVSSHDPGRIYFSENTSIGEVLIICRRWKGTAPKPQTRVVNLARNPATPLDATSVANRIDRAGDIEEPAAPDFTVQQVDADRIGRGDWFRRELPVALLGGSLPNSYRDRSSFGSDSAVGWPRRRRTGRSSNTGFLHALGLTHSVWTTSFVASQDGCLLSRWRQRLTRTLNQIRRSAILPTVIGNRAAGYCYHTGFGCHWQGLRQRCCQNGWLAQCGLLAVLTTPELNKHCACT